MNYITKIKQSLNNSNHGRLVFIISVYFSLLYHAGFLITFGLMDVKPLFFYNIFSVLLFIGIAVVSPKLKKYTIAYLFFYFEVVIHQILADYYLGGNAGFHYLIFLIGLLPLLTFENKLKLASLFGILSLILFVFFEVMEDKILPKYTISSSSLNVIRIINISLTAFVIFLCLIIFALVINLIENSLEYQVESKTSEVRFKNKRLVFLQNHIITSLGDLVESRDSSTGEHIKRTSDYVELIARKAMEKGLYKAVINEHYIDLLKKAAPMHDVGKIVVSDTILKKPGKLTDEEFSEMKRHTTEGCKIADGIVGISDDKAYVKMVLEVSKSHHERWDGNGYPDKLKAEDIPLSARIMAIADVFDALVSERCYKKAVSVDKAFEILTEESGTHFDPCLIEVFVENRSDVENILKRA